LEYSEAALIINRSQYTRPLTTLSKEQAPEGTVHRPIVLTFNSLERVNLINASADLGTAKANISGSGIVATHLDNSVDKIIWDVARSAPNASEADEVHS
jgi:hypothetical protein